jgi:hypothetical protein
VLDNLTSLIIYAMFLTFSLTLKRQSSSNSWNSKFTKSEVSSIASDNWYHNYHHRQSVAVFGLVSSNVISLCYIFTSNITGVIRIKRKLSEITIYMINIKIFNKCDYVYCDSKLGKMRPCMIVTTAAILCLRASVLTKILTAFLTNIFTTFSTNQESGQYIVSFT